MKSVIQLGHSYRLICLLLLLLVLAINGTQRPYTLKAEITSQTLKREANNSSYLPLIRSGVSFSGRIVMVGYERSLYNYDIYSMNADGSDRARVTNTSSNVINLSPSWSPDGTKIAFARLNNVTGGEIGIYIINADGSNLVRLTNSDGLGNDLAPDWSPDGSRIAYVTTNRIKEQIVVMNNNGSGAVVLTDDSYRSDLPHWSPDGSKIVYASMQNVEQNGRFEIFVMNADGSGKTRLTTNPNSDDSAPRWSPDGTKIAFYSFRNGQGATYIMNANGSNVQQVPNMPAAIPSWSPDGTKLMFVGRPDSTLNTEIYVINTDGTGLTRITETPEILEDSPDWRP